MNKTKQKYAILTGDLVGSRRLSSQQLEELFKSLNDLWSQFGAAHAGAVIGGVEIFRGDGWQAALAKPALCVEATLFLRAAFKAQPLSHKLDTRIGVGIGTVDALKENRLSESNGPAFQCSGDALDSLSKKDCRWALRMQADAPEAMEVIAIPIMDLAIQRWSRPEAVAVMGALLGWTQEETAEHPLSQKKDGKNPTRQAVADALGRVGWGSHWVPTLKQVQKLLGGDSR